MALTIAKVPEADRVEANKRRHVRDVTFDDSYPAGGEPLVAEDVGLNVLEEVIPHGVFTDGTGAVQVTYDHVNEKLVAFQQTDPADTGGADVPFVEVTAADDLTDYAGRVTFVGR